MKTASSRFMLDPLHEKGYLHVTFSWENKTWRKIRINVKGGNFQTCSSPCFCSRPNISEQYFGVPFIFRNSTTESEQKRSYVWNFYLTKWFYSAVVRSMPYSCTTSCFTVSVLSVPWTINLRYFGECSPGNAWSRLGMTTRKKRNAKCEFMLEN